MAKKATGIGLFMIAFVCTLAILGVSIHWLRMPFLSKTNPSIHDIWVINLDKDKERWANIMDRTHSLPVKVNRWPATYGKDLTRDQAQKYGAGYVITLSRDFEKDGKTDKITSANVGAVGCWISHKRLLTYLSTLPMSDGTGHLICEDDAEFPSGFLTGQTGWSKVSRSIPSDWDIVFLGIKKPVIGTDIAPGIKKMRSTYNKGNWGAHAYLVRHGALKTKILPSIEYMTNEIDVHYDMMADHWNIYICDPPAIQYNGGLAAKSNINA
jgi:GR25 family glycosyltransferase involved in LPS biosynthesis